MICRSYSRRPPVSEKHARMYKCIKLLRKFGKNTTLIRWYPGEYPRGTRVAPALKSVAPWVPRLLATLFLKG